MINHSTTITFMRSWKIMMMTQMIPTKMEVLKMIVTTLMIVMIPKVVLMKDRHTSVHTHHTVWRFRVTTRKVQERHLIPAIVQECPMEYLKNHRSVTSQI